MTEQGEFDEQLITQFRDVVRAMLSTPMDPEPWLTNPLLTAQGRALFAIWTGRARYPGELARVLGVGKSAASDVAEALVRAGLVERFPQTGPTGEIDRRYVTLRVTQAGHEACSNVAFPYQAAAATFFRRLARRDRQDLSRILQSLLKLADELAGRVRHGDADDGTSEDDGLDTG